MPSMLALLALAVCTPCHAAIVDSYAKTGMGRSFYRTYFGTVQYVTSPSGNSATSPACKV